MAKKEKALASRASKKEKEVEAPAKPLVTSAFAQATNVRVTPRKARLVADLIRGKDVKYALALLNNTNKAASLPISKVVKSAAANATNNFKMDESKLYISEIQIGDGLRMKRFLPRAKGSASGLVKRTCHINVTVKER